MKMRYSASIIWSEHDGTYLARVSELPGCLADGQTPQEAIANLVVIAEEWIEVAKEEGREIPEPMTAERLRTEAEKAHAQLQTLVQSAVVEAIEKQKREASSVPGWRGDPAEFELVEKPRT
jgi:predicted RNase H-like HicB family nuclease